MKPYRLLRNNKETGPYSAEELITMGLQAYDLVWLDGKSAAWRYPCEIPALKPYAPEAEDMAANFWKPASQQKSKPAPVKTDTEKPRFRIRADWRKIDDRAQMTDDRGSLEDREQKIETSKKAPQVVLPQAILEDDKAVPQVKYEESLDSIKQRYNETVLKRNNIAFPAIPRYGWLLLLVPALGLGMWIGKGWRKDKPAVMAQQTNAPVTSTPEKQVAAVSLQDAMAADEPATEPEVAPAPASAADPVKEVPEQVVVSTPVAAVKTTVPAAAAASVPLKTVVKPAAKNVTPVTTAVVQPKKAAVLPAPAPASAKVAPEKSAPALVAMAKSGAAPVVEKPAASKTAPVTAATGKKIADYVSVQEELQQSDEGKQMKLHVKNNTSTPVDLVVLDLQYYDVNGKFKKGETLYVNHLSANDAVALNAPAVKNAQRIDYKVSLLSIEKNGVYLIAE